jgi:nitrogen fixation/metabolism regulation signal transduction histidine kinase
MGSKRFNILIVVRVMLIMLTLLLMSLFFFLMERSQLLFTFAVFISLLIFQLWELIHFVGRINRELSKFLLSIQHSDTSIYFPKGEKNNELHKAFNIILDSIAQVKIDKEVKLQFLDRIVEQINIGLIALNEKDEIILMNSSAEKTLATHKPKTWEQLSKRCKGFTKAIDSMENGGQKFIEIDNKTKLQLSAHVSQTKLLDKAHLIITFQDIQKEIEQKESEAWVRLIRILNHEIMNSVTPISSLTETILLILEKEDFEDINAEKIKDVINCVKTIQKRSNGLFDFVTEYRRLSHVPMPKPEPINIYGFLQGIERLMRPELDKHKINFSIDPANKELMLDADPNQLEQVMINLLTNSIQAVAGKKQAQISLRVYKSEKHKTIELQDNGTGIEAEILKDIFVPFFTTKEKGSGIGLSLSNQIVRMHNGNISVKSTPRAGSTFSLCFG